MRYQKTYRNSNFSIKVFTNSKVILAALENFLDFNNSRPYSKQRIDITFCLDEVNYKNQDDNRNFLYRSYLGRNKTLSISFGNSIATVTANPKTRTVNGTILNYKESSKERLLDLIFMQPLRFILVYYGLFLLHASVVCKDRNCIIISGPQDSGKSTLALVLAQNGFDILTDDKCFIKLVRNQTQLFPFPAKMGLNDKILKRFPELTKHTLKNYRYGRKRRLSLNAISSLNNSDGLRCKAIIFPKYIAKNKIYLKEISQEKALERLMADSQAIYSKEESSPMLWTLYNITRETNSFELIYNDTKLDEIFKIVNRVF